MNLDDSYGFLALMGEAFRLAECHGRLVLEWLQQLELSTVLATTGFIGIIISLTAHFRRHHSSGAETGLGRGFTEIAYSVEGGESPEASQAYLRSFSGHSLTLVVDGPRHHKGTQLLVDLQTVPGREGQSVRGRVVKSARFNKAQGSWLLTVSIEAV